LMKLLMRKKILRKVNEDMASAELYLAKETLMDWPCFETRWTLA